MKRGDVIIISAPGDYGKPRSAVIVQADALGELGHESLAVCLLTTHTAQAPLFRLHLEPSRENGLKKSSQVMVDKIFTLPKSKVSSVIGHLQSKEIIELTRILAFVVGIH
ncbi:MAG: type II toxin-antitoxin system PemK/MazF family toxin [Coraliomargarita sp.]